MRVLVVAAALAAAGCVGGGGGGGDGAALPFERGEMSADGAPRCDFERWCVGVIVNAVLQSDGATVCIVPADDPGPAAGRFGFCLDDATAASVLADPCTGERVSRLWEFSVTEGSVDAFGGSFTDRDWSVRCWADGGWASDVVVKGEPVTRYTHEGEAIPPR